MKEDAGSGSGSRSVNRCLPVAARSFSVALSVFEEGKACGGELLKPGSDLD